MSTKVKELTIVIYKFIGLTLFIVAWISLFYYCVLSLMEYFFIPSYLLLCAYTFLMYNDVYKNVLPQRIKFAKFDALITIIILMIIFYL